MQNSTSSLPSNNAFNDLYPAILECFGIILLGYVAGRTKIVSPSNSKGLGNYVTYFALPALVFKAMVEMDFSKVNWMFWCSILISKALVFAVVYLAALFISRKLDLGRAGIFAIFASQSNDFALGYPIISSMYKLHHPDFVSYLYLVGPISLAMLNPIGFLSMEIQRNRQATHRHSRLVMFGHAIKGLVTNPIIIMVVLGIVCNFVFSHQLPTVISDFLTVLAESFSATALFFLGIGMVGKMKKANNSLFFLTPLLLIGCKLIMMPLVTRQVVLLLQPGGSDTNLTDSFSSFGFLYGTIPTAPSVYMFATLYGQAEDVIASSMVLCTFASAPMMFITATMVNLPVQTSAETQYLLSRVMVDVGCVGIACCVWMLIVFILSKRYNLIPHHFTMHLVVAQLLASVGIVLTRTVVEHSWVVILKSAILLIGVFSTRCWAALLAIALCIMRCRSLCAVLRLRVAFYIYGWAVPTLQVALIIAIAPPVYSLSEQTGVFQYGDWQLIASVVILGMNFILAVIALIILYRKDRYRHLYEVHVQTNNADYLDGESETERMLKNSGQEESNHNRSSDIEDMRTAYQTCSLSAGCSDAQRETCRRRTQQHQQLTVSAMEGTDLDPDDVVASHQLGRHILLLLLLLLSMTIGFSLCIWKLSGESQSSLYLMLEFLDTVLTYCQGFFTLAVFGFDTQNVIIPFYNAMRRLLCRKKYRRSSSDEVGELDDDTRHTVQQFTQHHINTCRKVILKDNRVGLPQSDGAFHGTDLIDWLVEVGLTVDRDAAVVYGNRLLIGQIITHGDRVHGIFQDRQVLYKFNYKDDSDSDDLQVVA